MLVSMLTGTTLTSKPGHHQTAIQTLPTTLGVDSQVVVRLDKSRNVGFKSDRTAMAASGIGFEHCDL